VGTVVCAKQVCHRCIAAKVDDATLRSLEAAVGAGVASDAGTVVRAKQACRRCTGARVDYAALRSS
jgi:ribosomal protein L40E